MNGVIHINTEKKRKRQHSNVASSHARTQYSAISYTEWLTPQKITGKKNIKDDRQMEEVGLLQHEIQIIDK